MYNAEIWQICVEDYRLLLEEYFRSKRKIPDKIEEVVKRGEEKIDEQIKMLKMADKVSWLAIDNYVTDPICEDDEDDERWKRVVREVKEES